MVITLGLGASVVGGLAMAQERAAGHVSLLLAAADTIVVP